MRGRLACGLPTSDPTGLVGAIVGSLCIALCGDVGKRGACFFCGSDNDLKEINSHDYSTKLSIRRKNSKVHLLVPYIMLVKYYF